MPRVYRELLCLSLCVAAVPPLAAQPGGELKPVVFGQGFFSQEQGKTATWTATWRWMGDGLPKDGPLPIQGLVFLRNLRKDMVLEVRGTIVWFSRLKPVHITLSLNGAPLETFEAGPTLEKVFQVPAEKQGAEDYSELRLSVDKFFVPKEQERNSNDTRRLAFKLTGLTWVARDAPTAVAAFPPPPQAEPIVPAKAEPVVPGTPGPMRGWRILVPLALASLALAVWLAIRQRRREQERTLAAGNASSNALPRENQT